MYNAVGLQACTAKQNDDMSDGFHMYEPSMSHKKARNTHQGRVQAVCAQPPMYKHTCTHLFPKRSERRAKPTTTEHPSNVRLHALAGYIPRALVQE